jgi:hypothetical protein
MQVALQSLKQARWRLVGRQGFRLWSWAATGTAVEASAMIARAQPVMAARLRSMEPLLDLGFQTSGERAPWIAG